MDELVDQFGADFVHRREKAQAQIVARDVLEEVGIKRGVGHRQRPQQNLFTVMQSNVAFEHLANLPRL